MANPSFYQPRALVLVVDDDVTICSIAHAYLQLEGYRVKTAANGEEAVAVLREHVPCAMVVDLRMPVMGGAELRRWQLATAAVADVPFILMSASPALYDAAKTLAAANILEKPFANEELKTAIERVCGPAPFN
jgi:CheY-like chemotaxis protein